MAEFHSVRRIRVVCLIVVAMMYATQSIAEKSSSSRAGEELVYTLYVTRHGVRSPTSDVSQYDRFSSAPWPKWSVPPGYLTPHGYELMKLFGAYDREQLVAEGLISDKGCADASRISIHADSDQRTRETAKALAEGMFPGCKVAISANKEGTNDPLFHLPTSAVSLAQAQISAAAMLGRVGGNPSNIAVAFHAPLAELDSLLTSCGKSFESHKRTSIFNVPASIDAGHQGRLPSMRGPLNTASTLSENLLLEYTEGMPAEDVGWGCVDGQKLRELINLHTEASELVLRTPEVAMLQASALLRAIARSVEQATSGHAVTGAEGQPGDKVLILVGHDTNLSSIAGALHLDWLADGRLDDTPPGSALMFEVWKNRKSGTYSVRTFFTAQTLEQMRNATPLTSKEPPPKVPVFIPMCSQTDNACNSSSFERTLESAAEGRTASPQ